MCWFRSDIHQKRPVCFCVVREVSRNMTIGRLTIQGSLYKYRFYRLFDNLRSLAMPINYIDYPLNPGQFVNQASQKTHVVWHGTQGRTVYTPSNGNPGQATTSIDWWNNDSQGRVGANYLIDRSGAVYRCFDEILDFPPWTFRDWRAV